MNAGIPNAQRARFRRAIVSLWAMLLALLAGAGPLAAQPSGSERQRLLNHPYHGFELIVQIDKGLPGSSLHAQRLRVHRYVESEGRLDFIARWWVSTGAEEARENKIGRVTPRTTLVGTYPVEQLRDSGYSNSWDGLMLYSLFYDVAGGYAIHATDPNKYSKLGQRASGGCTRLEQKQARYLFNMVAETGKGWTLKLDRSTGNPIRDSNGNPVAQWTYKTLVLIEENGRSEPTRFGFLDRDEVFKTPTSYAYYTQPGPALPTDQARLTGDNASNTTPQVQ